MIEKIECCHGTRTALDHLYEDVCQTIFSEMDKYLNVKNNNVTRTRRKLKISKPFWNDELTCLWKDMRRHQNIFTNCTGNSNLKTNLRKKYQSAQKLLDKKNKQYERKYKQNQILEIERINKHNPTEFWQHIKSLGPRKQNIIPMKVNTKDGVVDTTDEVLNEWQREFSNLYNHEPNNSEYDVNYFNQCQNRTLRFQLEPENHFINEPKSYVEINNAVQELKFNKSPGEDTIPNEILKLKPVICILYKLFHFLLC